MPFNEAIGLRVVLAGSHMLKPYLSGNMYHSMERKGHLLSMKTSRGIAFSINTSMREMQTAVTVIEDIWNRRGHFYK